MSIDPTMLNKFNGPIYAFIGLEFDTNIYSFALDENSSWKSVGNGVYAYANGDNMKSVANGDDVALTGTLTVKENSNFSSVTANDMQIKATGYGIMTSICSEGVTEAWGDYQAGGKQ